MPQQNKHMQSGKVTRQNLSGLFFTPFQRHAERGVAQLFATFSLSNGY